MFCELNDKAWVVGGYIRDAIMNIQSNDIDYVIADCDRKTFESILPEAKLVGKDFPVYMFYGNEVALARTERKLEGTNWKVNGVILNGYTAFEVKDGVTIQEDLGRRDFTINAIARKYDTKELYDPYNGIKDLEDRTLRAVNLKAFYEDPLRIYRGARFAARFDFKFDVDTWTLMNESKSGLKSITPDRVYIELKKMYEQSEKPSIFFITLKELHALQYHFKPLYIMTKIKAGSFEYHGNDTAFDHTMKAIDRCKANGYSFDIFLAVLFHDTGKGITKKVPEGERQKHIMHEKWSYVINKRFIEQHRFTSKQNELILLFARQHMVFHILQDFRNPIKLVRWYRLIKRHWKDLMLAANCDHELSFEQTSIMLNLNLAFISAKIDVPKHFKQEAINNYVEHAYAKAYRRISDDRA